MQRTRDKKSYKYIFTIAALFMCIFLSSCDTKKQPEKKDDTVVLYYGGNPVSVGETYIYYMTVAQKYELLYGKEVWQVVVASGTDGERSAEDIIREEVINEIVRVKTLVACADEYNVGLTAEEEELLTEEAEEFYKGLTDDDIGRMKITKEMVELVMRESRMARAVEEAMLAEDPVEISDENARMTTFYDMYFNCYIEDDEGNIIPFSDEQRRTQYERAMEACGELATVSVDSDKKQSIEDIAALYNLDMAGTYTMSPQEIKAVYGDDVCDMLYSMSNGEHSTVVETEYGYHVFKMIELTDKKATQAKKAVMTEAAINERLEAKLTELKDKTDKSFSYPDSVNMDAYDKITLPE